jgi:signal peptide peptidase SppA
MNIEEVVKLGVSGIALERLDPYFGAWAILEDSFRGIVTHVSGVDLRAHIDLNMQPAALAAASSRANGEAEVVDGVAVVNLSGVMMKTVSSLSSGTSTVNARRQIRSAIADPNVKAILMRIDSPGGTVAGTSDLADEITAAIAAGKPCYAYVEDLCASAAYWVASQCEKVFANTTAGVGSIGTYMTVYDAAPAAAQQGVKVHVVRAGAFKGVGTPGTEITPEQLGEMQRHVNALNDQFVAAVAKGRKFSAETAVSLADGRMHVGKNALSLGLIDGVQSFEATLSQLRAFAPASPISNPSPQRKGPKSMSTATPSSSENTPVAPVVQTASAAQLKTAFPKATSDFILAQLERGATIEQARAAWGDVLQAQNESLSAENAKLKKGGAPVLTEGRRKPVAAAAAETEAASGFEGDARSEMSRLVADKMKLGLSRQQAIKAVASKNPELHRAYLEQSNKPAVHHLIAERFEE